MLSEGVCLSILQYFRGKRLIITSNIGGVENKSSDDDATTKNDIYKNLLGKYSLKNIDEAYRWLEICGYFTMNQMGIAGPKWIVMTDKARKAADENRIPDEDRILLYQEEDPLGVFIAHQFNKDDTDIVNYIRDKVLTPIGLNLLDGRVDGLEDFRRAIINKIRKSRFFLCLLTQKVELTGGTFASSVWLYQETGVAVAFGKKPLLLVEEGIDSKYVGELQSIYEHILFTRSNHPAKFESIGRRILADLESNNIVIPKITA